MPTLYTDNLSDKEIVSKIVEHISKAKSRLKAKALSPDTLILGEYLFLVFTGNNEILRQIEARVFENREFLYFRNLRMIVCKERNYIGVCAL